MQRQEDKRLLPYMIGAFVLIVAVSVAVGVWSGGFTMITMIPLGVVLGALVAFIIFGRRAQRSVYRKAEGQTGAAAWALENLRGKWRVTPGVAATGHFDAVHRVIGRPGVILVGEGSAARIKPLLAREKKTHSEAGRRRPDLRHHRRQRRRRGSTRQAGTAPDPAAGQHHRQTDGRAGIAAERAEFPRRNGRDAERPDARAAPRCAASSARFVADKVRPVSAVRRPCRSSGRVARARRRRRTKQV